MDRERMRERMRDRRSRRDRRSGERNYSTGRGRGRDGRNPYGSRGGYVVDGRNPYGSRGGYVRSDRNMGEDYGYENDYRSRDREYDGRHTSSYDRNFGFEVYPMDFERGGQYRGYDRNYRGGDGHSGSELDREELKEWAMDLMDELNENEKQMFRKEDVIRKAEDMGIKFKDYSEEELYVVTLMLFSDYKKTVGVSSPEMYIALARDWFEDDDAELNGSEKLSAYYYTIVCGE